MTIATSPVTAPPDAGDHDRYSHWVAESEAARAYVTGEPIMALCGKFWTPSRDPERYPICPTCAEIKAGL